ncbi:hypothetical protein AAG906_030797 [Vitis piasezkii]
MRWCITEGKTVEREEFGTKTNLYNCGFPSNYVVPYFATTMSSLWNMLLNCSGREIWWRMWSGVGPLQSDCLKLKELPEGLENMGSLLELFLDGTAIKEIPSSIQHLSGLVLLNMRECKSLAILPHGICCSKLDNLSEGLGSLQGLEKLEAAGTAIKELPPLISLLENLELLPTEIPRSWVLQLSYFFGLRSLRKLNLSDCNILEGAIPSDFSSLCSLEYLDLSRNNLVTLPASLNQLSQLKGLRLVSTDPRNGGLQFAFSNCFRLSENESNNFSIGSTVTVHMSPNRCKARLMGLAVCAIFVVKGAVHDCPEHQNSSDEGHRFIKSDHMWLGYQPISRIGIGHGNGLNMLSQIQASFQVYGPSYEVKKCGVHLLYEQDENEDNQPEFQCSTTDENSSFFTIKDYGELTHLLFTMLI